jgi:UDP:flavonoid glycosyltransferase YjiC (YdhE family)
MRKPTVLICCWGTLGELHPLLSLARVLVKRGVDVHVACDEQFRKYLAVFRIGWQPLEPPIRPADADPSDHVRRLFARRGTRRLSMRVDAAVEAQARSVRDAVAALGGSDLLVGSWLTPGAAVVAERDGIPWAHTHIYPFSVMHPADLPVPAESPHGRTSFTKARFKRYFERLFGRTLALRRAEGLPPLARTAIEASPAAAAEIALLPEWLMRAPASALDRPVLFAGFPDPIRFPATLGPRITQYLGEGTPPVLVTLGSALPPVAAARHAAIVEACRKAGRRAIIVDGSAPADAFSAEAATLRFVSPVLLLPHCAASVNHGGINSIGEALRFGKPMVVVPHAFDQFDNAARIEWLGVGRAVPGDASLGGAVASVLEEPRFAAAAALAAGRIAGEDGSEVAAEAILRQLPTP